MVGADLRWRISKHSARNYDHADHRKQSSNSMSTTTMCNRTPGVKLFFYTLSDCGKKATQRSQSKAQTSCARRNISERVWRRVVAVTCRRLITRERERERERERGRRGPVNSSALTESVDGFPFQFTRAGVLSSRLPAGSRGHTDPAWSIPSTDADIQARPPRIEPRRDVTSSEYEDAPRRQQSH